MHGLYHCARWQRLRFPQIEGNMAEDRRISDLAI